MPLLDRVLVQRVKAETVRVTARLNCSFANRYKKTSTGIFLPSSATSSPLPEATVIATGPGAPDKEGKVVPTSVKAGDRVLLPGWGGNTIKVNEDVSLILELRSCADFYLGVPSLQRLRDPGQNCRVDEKRSYLHIHLYC